jgi:hypothetical protein
VPSSNYLQDAVSVVLDAIDNAPQEWVAAFVHAHMPRASFESSSSVGGPALMYDFSSSDDEAIIDVFLSIIPNKWYNITGAVSLASLSMKAFKETGDLHFYGLPSDPDRGFVPFTLNAKNTLGGSFTLMFGANATAFYASSLIGGCSCKGGAQ